MHAIPSIQGTHLRTSGAYTANLLGTIRSHLAGLQGYDVMALELFQNADDAQAEVIRFDITEPGLYIHNSGQFTYCGDLPTRPCAFMSQGRYGCDYHRIVDVASGGKLAKSDNIGRFGIGFVSTYQVADHPEIRSTGICLKLHPEDGQWFTEPFDLPTGTTFFLPWARDPNSRTRNALGMGHITPEHIERLVLDFQAVIRKSLLFLRKVRRAELLRQGQLLLACDLERHSTSGLALGFHPQGDRERWHILRGDAADRAKHLYERYPRLEMLRRNTPFSLGLRLEPAPLEHGLLYVFLPTEQLTGLPLHINADFFPEPDRKAVIFAGSQHEQAWNEMLIRAAASLLAQNLESLLPRLGPVPLWRMLEQAYVLRNSVTHPNCFKCFWEAIQQTGTDLRIAPTQEGINRRPKETLLPDKPLDATQLQVLSAIGGFVVIAALRPFHTVLRQLGANLLNLENLVTLLERHKSGYAAGGPIEFYRTLWSILNPLLTERPSFGLPVIQRLRNLPFMLSEDNHLVPPSGIYVAGKDAGKTAKLLPRLGIASERLEEFPRVRNLAPALTLTVVTDHLAKMLDRYLIEQVMPSEAAAQHEFYALLAELDDLGDAGVSTYKTLKKLPIWRSSRGWVKTTEALLPGDFTDPTGQANLLDASLLTEAARHFLTGKLGVKIQTVENFVCEVIPKLFCEAGPLDPTQYAPLVAELAKHQKKLLSNSATRDVLRKRPLAPTQTAGWALPEETYQRTPALAELLGNTPRRWLDIQRIPEAAQSFIIGLGVRNTPTVRHLVERMPEIARQSLPTPEARESSSRVFYALCKLHQDKDPNVLSEIGHLSKEAYFPAEEDSSRWYQAHELHAPHHAKACRSQVKVLAFADTKQLNPELLRKVGITVEPKTETLIRHLQDCVSRNTPPDELTYQLLNHHAARDHALIVALANSHCLHVGDEFGFVRPNQVYWSDPNLGRYAFKLPESYQNFEPLLNALGVKDAPEAQDFLAILLDIVAEKTGIIDKERVVYERCWQGIVDADKHNLLMETELLRLRQGRVLLNLQQRPVKPSEVLLQDSEWYTSLFKGELDSALCKLAPEFWEFVEKLGVQRLSAVARLELEFNGGQRDEEIATADALHQRQDIFRRYLHDKPTSRRDQIGSTLATLKAVSFEVIRIQASAKLKGHPVSLPPIDAPAFYHSREQQLYLARPVNAQSWYHILNTLFHILMPDAPSSEISKLTLGLEPLMSMTVEAAHCKLDASNFPPLEAGNTPLTTSDLSSPVLEDRASTPESDAVDDSDLNHKPPAHQRSVSAPTVIKDSSSQSAMGAATLQPPSQGSHRVSEHWRQNPTRTSSITPPTLPAAPPSSPSIHGVEQQEVPIAQTETPMTPQCAASDPIPRREQRDSRMLSYVQHTSETTQGVGNDHNHLEHNLSVETKARAMVRTYERVRGRIPEEMARTHPGYDMLSRNPLTDERRFIEVKGVSGEWNQTGVGLSRTQFSEAQNFGKNYWLYVVEHTDDPGRINVYTIQSPATQVTAFMFDGNWRGLSVEEPIDPAAIFTLGAKVRHDHWGYGTIKDVQIRSIGISQERKLTILFDQAGVRTVTLNLHSRNLCVVMDDAD